jgi:hypothetical protein
MSQVTRYFGPKFAENQTKPVDLHYAIEQIQSLLENGSETFTIPTELFVEAAATVGLRNKVELAIANTAS